MKKSRSLSAGVAVAALSLSLTLAGCGDEEKKQGGGDSGAAQGQGKASGKASVDPNRVSPKLPTAPTVRNAQGARQDLKLGQCGTSAGKQKVTGVVRNSSKQAGDYLVKVNWINSTYDVRGMGFAVAKNVKPGQSKKITISAQVASGATQCVPNVERGKVG